MTKSNPVAARRLDRLQRVLTARQQRLARSIARAQGPVVEPGPASGLQRYGYPVALGLAATAVMPALLGFAWRRRKLLLGAALNGVGLWKLRRRFDDARITGRGR